MSDPLYPSWKLKTCYCIKKLGKARTAGNGKSAVTCSGCSHAD